ncbi:MAG: alpha-amylase family glycosyl hydrolase [Candidatus Muirbacterium halophilum]|nr:alpha-amylase family glycosyl hydrolase [Candidatus Muirbacterium halophilum]MCK9477361.1 alpha-amylase family glycosyl hydrolase [Candidatus Muirbacterium halophilum]
MKWFEKAFIYHIFPLGFNGVLECTDRNSSDNSDKFKKLKRNIDYIESLGANTVFFGPVFESSSHGYDVNNLFSIDKRLGSNEDFKDLCIYIKSKNMKIVLDAVFHHSGRELEQFIDLKVNKENSKFKDWFYGVDFSNNNSFNDGFSYYGWNGDYSLVKYNLHNEEVRNYLLNAVEFWVKEFDIDGLRLDASDCLESFFLEDLRSFTENLKEDFWLMGEVVHGDYRRIFSDKRLHSVTNYECYKGMFSSFNDKNFYEIAYSLSRQFSKDGIYKNKHLYNFVDNHDVSRIFSNLNEKVHLFPLYILLFTIPGIPSLYYGSEFRECGIKHKDDNVLRPNIDMAWLKENIPCDIMDLIKKLAFIRKNDNNLIYGDYKELLISHEQFCFVRKIGKEETIIGINSSHTHKKVTIKTINNNSNRIFIDVLDNNSKVIEKNGNIEIRMNPTWGVILKEFKQ